jgi:hypothetical protein
MVRRRWPAWTALLGVLGLVLAGLVLPAGAQSAPAVTIDPFSTRCVAPGSSTSFSVTGTSSQSQLDLEFFAPSGARLQGPTRVFADGGWGVDVPFRSYPFTGSYEIRVTTVASSPGTPTATASVFLEVPCQNPTVDFSPTCFTPGVTPRVTFTARHFVPNQAAHSMQYDFQGPEQQVTGSILIADNHGVFTRSFSLKPLPSNRGYPGRASDSDGVLVALATWSPCPPATTTPTTAPGATTTPTTAPDDTTPDETTTSTSRPLDLPGTPVTIPPTIDLPPPTPGATLTVSPELGTAGFVTTATGTGFPPNAIVDVTWQPGIGHTAATVGADGRFVVHALVFPNDRLGPRALVAQGGGTTAFDAFLVVQSTVQPSGQNVQQINRIRRFNQR